MRKKSAFTLIEIVVVVALLGAAATWLAPKVFHGDSRRAKQSQEATADLLDAQKAKEGNIAASVVVIGQANAEAPASPSKEFIAREVPLALSQLSAPDAIALLEASERKKAVMEGQLKQADKLYGQATAKVEDLVKKLAEAEEQRKASDLAISEAAAYKLGAERTKMMLGAGIAVLVLVAAYLKFYGISQATMGRIAADARSGVPVIQAIDAHLAPWLHSNVNKHARLNTPQI
jgi:prepilin-type N-terminal cleavage/methylation domain-containing protein